MRSFALALSLAFLLAGSVAHAQPSDGGCPMPSPNPDIEALSELSNCPIRMDCVVPAEIALAFEEEFNTQLARTLEAHPEISRITRNNVDELTDLGGGLRYTSLAWTIRELLDRLGQQSAAPSTLRAHVLDHALEELEGAGLAADACVYRDFPSEFYYAWQEAQAKKAFSLAKSPSGADIEEMRNAWKSFVREKHTTLDENFLLPVYVGKKPTLRTLRRVFKLYGFDRESYGWDAVDDFANAHEGPGGHRAFAPIADKMKHSTGIKKRWYFTGGGDEWSANVLIVLDEHGQAWGYRMGYSE